VIVHARSVMHRRSKVAAQPGWPAGDGGAHNRPMRIVDPKLDELVHACRVTMRALGALLVVLSVFHTAHSGAGLVFGVAFLALSALPSH